MLFFLSLQFSNVDTLSIPICSLKELASQRKEQLENSLTLQQFYCDLDEEETWIK